MNHKEISKLKTLANHLKRTAPGSHKDLFAIHQAPAKIDDLMDASIELDKWQAVKAFAESIQKDHQGKEQDEVWPVVSDSRMETIQKEIEHYQGKLNEASELENQLTGIATGIQLKQAAEAAGATTARLAALAAKDTGPVSTTIDDGSEDAKTLQEIEQAIEDAIEGNDGNQRKAVMTDENDFDQLLEPLNAEDGFDQWMDEHLQARSTGRIPRLPNP